LRFLNLKLTLRERWNRQTEMDDAEMRHPLVGLRETIEGEYPGLTLSGAAMREAAVRTTRCFALTTGHGNCQLTLTTQSGQRTSRLRSRSEPAPTKAKARRNSSMSSERHRATPSAPPTANA
jgi:hypothetical protein